MLNEIEAQATKLAWVKFKDLMTQMVGVQESKALAVKSQQTRRASFAEIAPTQHLAAVDQHRERFTPLQRMLDHVAPLLLDVRDRYFAYGAEGHPKIVLAHHYEKPFTENGPNLYHASLTLLDLDPELDPNAPNKMAFIVYALADQYPPTQQARFLGIPLRSTVPGNVNYALCTRFQFIDGQNEPTARDFLERIRDAKEDLELITPWYDLYQNSPGGGIEFSSEPAEHLNVKRFGSHMAGVRFDPERNQFTEAERFLGRNLAELLASHVPLNPDASTDQSILAEIVK